MKGWPLLSPCPFPKGFRMCHCLFQLQPPRPRIQKLLICSETANCSIRLLSPSLKQQISLVQTDNHLFFCQQHLTHATSQHKPAQRDVPQEEEGPLSLPWEGRSRARGEHTHSTHIAPGGEHKYLQQNLRESTLRESSSPAPSALPSPAGLDPPSTHPSPFPVYFFFLPELKNDSEASAGQPVWDTAAGEALHAVGSRLCRKSGHTSASSQSKDHSGTLGYFPLTGLWEKPTKT